jgi:hypothetical protein
MCSARHTESHISHLQSVSSDANKVNVTAYCIAFDLDLKDLQVSLVERFGYENVHSYPEDLKSSQTADIVHGRFVDENGAVSGDVFYFEVRFSISGLALLLQALLFDAACRARAPCNLPGTPTGGCVKNCTCIWSPCESAP